MIHVPMILTNRSKMLLPFLCLIRGNLLIFAAKVRKCFQISNKKGNNFSILCDYTLGPISMQRQAQHALFLW